MSARGISHIYSSAPKNGGKAPVLGRPSDVEKKPGHSNIVDRVCDVHTKNGILRGVNVHKGNYGTHISVQGHEIKVYQVGPGVWFQKGLTIAEAPLQLHPRELADAGLTDKPVKIYSDFTRLAPIKHHQARQRNLKSPVRNLTPAIYLENSPHKGCF